MIAGSVITTALVVAPVAFHRVLFRQRHKEWLLRASNRCALVGLTTLAVTMVGVVFLVFDVVTDRRLSLVVAGVLGLFFAALWVGVPRMRDRD